MSINYNDFKTVIFDHNSCMNGLYADNNLELHLENGNNFFSKLAYEAYSNIIKKNKNSNIILVLIAINEVLNKMSINPTLKKNKNYDSKTFSCNFPLTSDLYSPAIICSGLDTLLHPCLYILNKKLTNLINEELFYRLQAWILPPSDFVCFPTIRPLLLLT